MAKIKKNEKARRPLFKKGDVVSFLFGSGNAIGQIVEDRGCLGVGGRRLYGIHFEINPGEQRYIEVPEEELTAHEIEAIEEAQRAIRKGNLITLEQVRHAMGHRLQQPGREKSQANSRRRSRTTARRD